MLWNNLRAPLKEPMSINKFRKLIKLYLTTDSEKLNIFLCICHVALLYCVEVFMGTCKMLITLFLCLDWWVVGWVVFHHFHVLFLLIFLY